ncbi:MAG TPA: acetyl-CoA carboxylase biotin carboxyl carrier protein subunit [Thermoanaerobaculaceae bacterium]|nr:acetyl-CoA carboxylase biotin carboxyl carrier protein subunit [Thermoanaerobaculaceae bacterium]
MAGVVLAVHVATGQAVAQGDLLFVVESMKMQIEIRSPAAGTVADVRVRQGQALAGPDVLAVLTAD